MSVHRACNDFHRTSEAERSRFLDSPLTRRQVIGAGLGTSLAIYAARALPFARALEAAEAQAAAAPSAPVLVCVFLPGGCDLLDTLVPLNQEGRYADLRGGTRVTDPQTLGGTGLGIHPSLTQGPNGGVKGLFDRGAITFLPGIDYANPDLSHFHSRHFWESGVVTAQAATGWLGRFLDTAGGGDNPFQGVSMGWTLSPVLRSAGAPAAALSDVGGGQLTMDGLSDQERALALAAWPDLTAALAADAPTPGRAAVARTAALMTKVQDTLAPYAQQAPPQPNGLDALLTGVAAGGSGGGQLGQSLTSLAQLLALPLGVRVATVNAIGDFDTHDGQELRLRAQLAQVSVALSQFQADLESRGLADRVLTLVWTEFGRRPQANDSGGTDHGAGGLAWVQGPRVRGGIASDYPNLGQLDPLGNLAVTMDFRRLYSSLLEQWLGVDAASVIPNAAAFGRVALVN